MQNKMTNVRISETEKDSDLLQSKPHLPLQCLSFIILPYQTSAFIDEDSLPVPLFVQLTKKFVFVM